MERFNARIAAISFLIALLLIGVVLLYPIFMQRLDGATLNNIVMVALGAIIGPIQKGGDWFMRGRVTAPTTDDSPPPAGGNGGDTTVTIPNPPDPPIVVRSGGGEVRTGTTGPSPRPATPA